MAWLLGTIRELKLDPAPSVAVMPLGTGNDLSLSFGWGNTFLHKWIKAGATAGGCRPENAAAALCACRCCTGLLHPWPLAKNPQGAWVSISLLCTMAALLLAPPRISGLKSIISL